MHLIANLYVCRPQSDTKFDKREFERPVCARMAALTPPLIQAKDGKYPAIKLADLTQLYLKCPELKPPVTVKLKDAQIKYVVERLTGAPLSDSGPAACTELKQDVSPRYFELARLVREHGLVTLKYVAILAGCDYYSLQGIGMAKAVDILSETLSSEADHNHPEFFRALAQAAVKRSSRLDSAAVTSGLRRAFVAFHHAVVFDPNTIAFVHASQSSGDEELDPDVVGVIPAPENLGAAIELTMGLASVHTPAAPAPITGVMRLGEALPTSLQCWMVPGSRPSLLPEVAPLAEVKRELNRQGICTEGDDDAVLELAQRHRVTVRKPPEQLTGDECRGVLRSREVSAQQGASVVLLREQVRRLYDAEDQVNYGPPRLKDRVGISLLTHLIRAGRTTLSLHDDTSFPVPTDKWVGADLGLPVDMTMVREYFVPIGESLTGEFTSKAIKEAWARIVNLTLLQNFLYHGREPVAVEDVSVASAVQVGEGLAVESEEMCYYKMNVPASMKSVTYETVVRLKVRAGRIVQVISGRCGADCASG